MLLGTGSNSCLLYFTRIFQADFTGHEFGQEQVAGGGEGLVFLFVVADQFQHRIHYFRETRQHIIARMVHLQWTKVLFANLLECRAVRVPSSLDLCKKTKKLGLLWDSNSAVALENY